MSKYRVVQTEESKYEVQEYKPTFSDPRDREPYYDWVTIDKCVGDSAFAQAKAKVDQLVEKSKYPKVVYEKGTK